MIFQVGIGCPIIPSSEKKCIDILNNKKIFLNLQQISGTICLDNVHRLLMLEAKSCLYYNCLTLKI